MTSNTSSSLPASAMTRQLPTAAPTSSVVAAPSAASRVAEVRKLVEVLTGLVVGHARSRYFSSPRIVFLLGRVTGILQCVAHTTVPWTRAAMSQAAASMRIVLCHAI